MTTSLPQYGHFIPAYNGVNQVLGATYKCGMQSTEPAPRAGSCRTRSAALAPAGFPLIERRVAAPVRECVMKNIADLLLRVWQRSQPASNTQVRLWPKTGRSSMADFVRILHSYNQDRYGRS
jgi:hypothetical protein